MRILLTNDDGIGAPGLIALYRAIADLGEVHVVAPAVVQSAMSHAVTFHRPVKIHPRKVAFDISHFDGADEDDHPQGEHHADHFEGIAVDGRPADCVKLALTHLIPTPVDLVISGMNSGANVGVNVIYSGTVAAAMEAAFIGVPAIAVSLHIGDRAQTRWRAAARHARQAIDQILQGPIQQHTVLNLNIPILDDGAPPKGLRVTPINTSPILDRYHEIEDPPGQIAYQAMDGFGFHHTPPDTDVDALFDRYMTLTPLHFDLTQKSRLAGWEKHLQG